MDVAPRSAPNAVLPPAFYSRPVLEVARDLVGCSFLSGGGGRIVETEAYAAGGRGSYITKAPGSPLDYGRCLTVQDWPSP